MSKAAHSFYVTKL